MTLKVKKTMPLQKLIWLVLLLSMVSISAPAKEVKEYYESGELKEEKNIENGAPHGPARVFYKSGSLKEEATYDRGKLLSKKSFRPDGKDEYSMYYDERGRKVETETKFYASGKKFRENTLINGKLEGWEKEYYPNGKLRAERHYVAGKKEGEARGYYQNGNVQGDWYFKNGVPSAATIFYPTGEKHLVHKFKDGRIHGETKEYDKKGEVMAIRMYKDDRMVERRRVKHSVW